MHQYDNARKGWIQCYGLQLYNKRCTQNIKNHLEYDHQAVDSFFQYLSSNGAGKSVMVKAKTFLNTNLKCEHYSRLVEAGMYGELVEVKVGASLAVKKCVGTVASQAASHALETCQDLQADLEQLLSPSQIRGLSLSAF